MTIEQTFSFITNDIKNGNYGKACDRLHGLISTYPNDLSLRKKLGDIYWTSKFPAKAGLYWYLECDKTDDMLKACLLFEQSCGNNDYEILRTLKFRGDINSIDSYARDLLINLRDRASSQGYIELGPRPKKMRDEPSNKSGWLFGLVLLALLALMIIGAITAISWIF